MAHRRLVCTCVLVFAVLGSAGCFGVRNFDVAAGHEGFAALHPELSAVQPTSGGGSVAVALAVPETTGCIPLRLADGSEKETLGDFRCDVIPVSTAAAKDDLKRAYRELTAEDGEKQKWGVVWESYGETLRAALAKHLGAHYGAVDVQRVDAATDGANGVAQDGTFYFQFWRTDTKRMVITLTATPEGGGAPVTASAEVAAEMGNGHLAWMIPVGVLTFPIGYAIGVLVFDNMETDFTARVVAQAIDEASRKLAAAMAAAPPPAPVPAPAPAAAPAAPATGEAAPPPPPPQTSRYRVVPTVTFI